MRRNCFLADTPIRRDRPDRSDGKGPRDGGGQPLSLHQGSARNSTIETEEFETGSLELTNS